MATLPPERLPTQWAARDMAYAVLRVHRGEALQTVAVSVGRTIRELSRAVDQLTDPKDVAAFLKSLAAEFNYTAETEFGFDFVDVPGKRYRPDCVWFDGGVTPANVVALAMSTPIRFFVVTPERSIGVPTKTLELFRKHLADRWHLAAAPIAGFSPEILRREIAATMSRGSAE